MKMENEFYEEDDFTQFLKDSTEDFKMYPGRRIWHSLYKDMHPSQKWPSVAVCLLLISSIVYLGIANNNNINKNSVITITERKVPANSPFLAKENNQVTTNLNAVAKNSRNNVTNSTQPNATQMAPDDVESLLSGSNSAIVGLNNETYEPTTTANTVSNINNTVQAISTTTIQQPIVKTEKNLIKSVQNKQATNFDERDEQTSTYIAAEDKDKLAKVTNDKSMASTPTNEHRSFMDNDIFYNLNRPSLFKKRTSLNYYITPSVGFRTLKQKSIPEISSSAIATPLSATAPIEQSNINKKVSQSYAVNMEAGAGINYKLTKKLALTGGIQFNYTNYISYASRLPHSEVANLYIGAGAEPNEEQRASAFANTVNSNYTILNNTTVQFSIPVGLEYGIISGKKLTWQIGGTIQPGIIASGRGYALSTDNTHYIEDRTLLSNTVLNSSLQTTISYRTKNGVSIFAGPQLRYQLTDTHKAKYNYSERLYNYGVKLGLSRNF